MRAETTAVLAKAGMLAQDGRCKTLDSSADGYMRGEACVVHLLESCRGQMQVAPGKDASGHALDGQGDQRKSGWSFQLIDSKQFVLQSREGSIAYCSTEIDAWNIGMSELA